MSEPASLYERLSAPFSTIHKLPARGGSGQLSYITGEQCITRLNEVLGWDGWSFEVKEHGYNQEADEVWVFGRLTVYVGDRTIVKEQAGSQEVKRLKSSGEPLEIGFDLKGAATDALKKCATLLGVGLYLYEKDGIPAGATTQQTTARPAPAATRPAPPKSQPPVANGNGTVSDPQAPIDEKQYLWYVDNLGRANELKVDLTDDDTLQRNAPREEFERKSTSLLARIQTKKKATP